MENNSYYVYLHRKLNGDVFYVGKGKGRRAYKNTRRSALWNYTKNKYGLIVEIYKDNLSEQDALTLEAKLIKQFGRIDLGTGTLVNFTDGGDSTNLSAIARKKISEKQKERFLNPDERARVGAKSKGRESKRKINPYMTIGNAAGEVLQGTLSEILILLGDNLRPQLLGLIAGRVKSVHGWVLNPTEDKFKYSSNTGIRSINLRRKDKLKYEFVTKNMIFIGTKDDFKIFSGLKSTSPLFVNEGHRRVVKGWGVIREGETFEYVFEIVNKDYTPRYVFCNDDLSETFTGTNKEFSTFYGINLSSTSDMFRKNKPRKVRGWYIKERL